MRVRKNAPPAAGSANTARSKTPRSLSRSAPGGTGLVCSGERWSWVRPALKCGPSNPPARRSTRTCSFTAAALAAPGQSPATAAGSVTIVRSGTSTAVKRAKTASATGSAATTVCTASRNSASKKPAAGSVKRWSNPCGLSSTPSAAVVCVNWPRLAAGCCRQPNTALRAKTAPVSFDRRRTNPVCSASRSAVSLNSVRIARATPATLATKKPSGRMVVNTRPYSPKGFFIVTLG